MKKSDFLKHPFTKRFILEQIQPLRVLFYYHLVSFFVRPLEMKWESATFVFSNISLLILANIVFIVVIDYDKIKKKGRFNGILWIYMILLGLLVVEYVGIAGHAILSFGDPENSQVRYSKMIVLLFTGIGGYFITITNFIGEKLDERVKLTKKLRKIFAILITGITIALVIYSIHANPTGWKIITNYFSGLF